MVSAMETQSLPAAAMAAHIRNVILAYRYIYASEREFQEGVGAALAPFQVSREHALAGLPGLPSRVDFLVAHEGIRVAVELKVGGAPKEVLRQIMRYADSTDVDALLLVTSRAQHRYMPSDVRGKPLRIAYVGAPR